MEIFVDMPYVTIINMQIMCFRFFFQYYIRK